MPQHPDPPQTDTHRTEAQAIYRALFGGEAPELLSQRYRRAAQEMDRRADPRQLAAVQQLLEQGVNLEAAELAGRLTGRLPLLTRKFAAMTYLAETLPDHQMFYVNRRTDRAAGLAALTWSAALTALRLAQGLWLLRQVRHG